MPDDVQAVAAFYATARGRMAQRLLRRHMAALWPDLSGQVLLGLGHATPYLDLWRGRARHCIDAATGGPEAWPGAADCLVQDDALPFPELSLDRVLVVHGLENAASAPRLLRAVGRALRDDGRLLLLVPNRTGLWAHVESTPFADGAPCSAGRVERLLNGSLFRVERLRGALYPPPSGLRPLLRMAPALEAAGRHVTPRLAGVLLVEAVKDVYAAIPPVRAGQRARLQRRLVPLGAVPAGRHRKPAGGAG